MRWETIDFVVRAAARWLFRVRNPESWIFRGAVLALVTVHGANRIIKYDGPIGDRSGSIEIGMVDSAPDVILWSVSVTCILLMIGSAVWAWKRYTNEQKGLLRKKVFVIEGRGLRDDDGSPLQAAVPDSISGSRIEYLLDLRQRKDGVIVEPEDLIQPISAMKTWLHQIQRGNDRSDLTTVYGGLTAVPLTFLTGLLLDDEGDIVVMDWDRTSSRWRLLDGPDDGLRFEIAGIEEVERACEVVLAISASYLVKPDDLATTFTYPVVRMTMPKLQSSHWSQAKQSALADQFFGVLKQLDAMGVDRIHLVLAAQNSVVVNLARRYDKRNLPKLTVYQFERARELQYPWGVEMPVSGASNPQVTHVGGSETLSPAG